jgi:hypothetical protein
MIEFRQAQHTQRPTDVVEVWVDGDMLAVIYPHREDGIKIISQDMVEEPKETGYHGVSCWPFRFKKRP